MLIANTAQTPDIPRPSITLTGSQNIPHNAADRNSVILAVSCKSDFKADASLRRAGNGRDQFIGSIVVSTMSCMTKLAEISEIGTWEISF